MRHPAALAAVLAVGLAAAACGGDEATPEPANGSAGSPAASVEAEATQAAPATEAAAQSTEAAESGAAEASEAAADEFGTKANVTSEDDPAATYALTSGRYRIQWSTTGCEQVEFVVTQVDGDFIYAKPSKSSFASGAINDMPEGHYTVEQTDPGCTEWSVRIDRMSG